MSNINRMFNCKNPWQGDTKKVLCVCSAGLLRSPTAAKVIAQEYNYNTRAAGLDEGHALIVVDDVLIEWADEIVCMTIAQAKELASRAKGKPVICLNITDSFGYCDPELVTLIKAGYNG